MKTGKKPIIPAKPATSVWRMMMPWMASGAIAAAVLIVYWPAYDGGWIWDDATSVYSNPVVTRPDGLYRIWLTTEDYDFWPMTKTVFWTEYQFFKDEPGGYHKVNIALHAVACVLIYLVLRKLAVPAAALAALFFAVHPVNAASVAWVSELKNLLSMIFLALTVLSWLRFEGKPGRLWYALSLLAYAAALTSKTSVVMFPVMLLGLAWWKHGRITRRNLIMILPFFLLSAAMAAATVLTQTRSMVVINRPLVGLQKLAGAGWIFWFYIYKALVPVRLSAIYPHWKDTIASLGWIAFLPTATLTAVLAVSWLKRKTAWGRPLLVALGYSLLAMLPVLGFIDMAITMHSLVADHFQYLPILAVIVFVCAAGWKLAGRGQVWRTIVSAAATAVLVGLAAGTFTRAHVLASDELLWRDTIAKNPQSWMAHYNLATELTLEHDRILAQSRTVSQEAQQLWQKYQNLGAQSRKEEAATCLQEAEAKKNEAEEQVNHAHQLCLESVFHYRNALTLEPLYIRTYNNLALALINLGQSDEAIELYRKGIELDEKYYRDHRNPFLWCNLGMALARKQMLPEAVSAFKESLLLYPEDQFVWINLIQMLRSMKKYDEVVELLTGRLQMHPDDKDAHRYLADALLAMGKTDQALLHIRKSVELDPSSPPALAAQGDILLASGQVQQALQSYAEAVQAQRQRSGAGSPELQFKLAAAQSRAGRNADALAGFLSVLQANPGFQPAEAAIRELTDRLGHTADAAACYERALSVRPDWIEGLLELAWIRSTHRDPAVRNTQQAMSCLRQLQAWISVPGPAMLDVYAAVLAEAGQFPEAVNTATDALRLARDRRDEALARQIESRLKLYSAGRPYREF